MANLKPYIGNVGGEQVTVPITVNSQGVFMGKLPANIRSVINWADSSTESSTLEECKEKIKKALEAAHAVQKPVIEDWIYYLFFCTRDGFLVEGTAISVNAVIVRTIKWGQKTEYKLLREDPFIKNGKQIDQTEGVPVPLGLCLVGNGISSVKAHAQGHFSSENFAAIIQGYGGFQSQRIPYTAKAWDSIQAITKSIDLAYSRLKELTETPELLLANIEGNKFLLGPANEA